ncbi:hypothetical protein [Paraconexibacter sp. AEG42_29]
MGIRRIGAALGALAVIGAFAPSGAAADTTSPSWNCRASVAYVLTNLGIAPLNRIEPFAANGQPTNSAMPDNPVCADDTQAVPHIEVNQDPLSALVKLDADAVKGVTQIDPDIAAARDQTATATVAATDVDLTLASIPIHVDAILSSATVKCQAGVPTFQSTSLVAGLEIAGQAVPLQEGLVQISTVVNGSPLAQLVRIQIGGKDGVTTGDATTDIQTRTQTAIRVELLNVTGSAPLAAIVLGEAKVSRQGRTCDADSTPPGPVGPSPNDPNSGNTVTVTTPGGTTTPSIIYVPIMTTGGDGSGSGTGQTTTIELNGQNGGCGKLSMYFAVPKKPKFRSSVYGNRVVTRGRLISCGGKPIVGGRVDVYHVIKGKTTRIRKTGVRSRAGGLITLILPLNLTTRKIVFEYRGNLASSKITSSQSLSLTVRYKGKVITKEPGPVRKPSF